MMELRMLKYVRIGKLYKERDLMIKNYNKTITVWNSKDYLENKYPILDAKQLYSHEFLTIYEELTKSSNLKSPHLLMIKYLNLVDRCTEELEYCFNDIETIIKKSNRLMKEFEFFKTLLTNNSFLERGKKTFINERLRILSCIKLDAETYHKKLVLIRSL